MVTVGKTETGRPVCKLLKPVSYFRTYNEAYKALVKYNDSGIDIHDSNTLEEVYNEWFAQYSSSVSKSRAAQYRSAWNYCGMIKDKNIASLTNSQIRNCITNGCRIDNGNTVRITEQMKPVLKGLLSLVYDYAVELNLVSRNIPRELKSVKGTFSRNSNIHKPYTDEELDILWSHKGENRYIDFILIQCYSGWRPSELINLKLDNINFEDGIMTGGMKTESGRNRIVPIHSKIEAILRQRYDEEKSKGHEILFASRSGKPLSLSNLSKALKSILSDLGINETHKAHDGRVTFVTNAKRHNVDEYAIKLIVGHSITDITEKTYTYRDPEWLHFEMEKIK